MTDTDDQALRSNLDIETVRDLGSARHVAVAGVAVVLESRSGGGTPVPASALLMARATRSAVRARCRDGCPWATIAGMTGSQRTSMVDEPARRIRQSPVTTSPSAHAAAGDPSIGIGLRIATGATTAAASTAAWITAPPTRNGEAGRPPGGTEHGKVRTR